MPRRNLCGKRNYANDRYRLAQVTSASKTRVP